MIDFGVANVIANHLLSDYYAKVYLWNRLLMFSQSCIFSVFDERKNYQEMEALTLGLEPGEVILSVGKNRRQPVQKWSGTLVWPGRLTLTDRALYFEVSMLFLQTKVEHKVVC